MRWKSLVIAMGVALLAVPILADDVLYRYEGDVLPYHESAGWDIADPCDEFCAESVQDGRFVLTWLDGTNLANYRLIIANAPDLPPPPCGSSGASARASPSGASSPRATGASP